MSTIKEKIIKSVALFVLSFNLTHTYERLYLGTGKYNYGNTGT
ncbi:hypothetical protein [Dyadobacter fanqingshengii]|nr:hypothetical protein [Dyadobacter fanqingshengii]